MENAIARWLKDKKDKILIPYTLSSCVFDEDGNPIDIAIKKAVSKEELDKKMDKGNPTGSGCLSLNRKSNSIEGANSSTLGTNNVASGRNSHAEGVGTVASSANQHVQGTYNKIDSSGAYAHIIGGGSGESNRLNLHTLDWLGNATYLGDIISESGRSLNEHGHEIEEIEGLEDTIPTKVSELENDSEYVTQETSFTNIKILDDITEKVYILGVSNGKLYIEEFES